MDLERISSPTRSNAKISEDECLKKLQDFLEKHPCKMCIRDRMNELFADVPEALSNTLEILDKVEYYSIDHAPIMPTFAIPKDFGTEEGYRCLLYTSRCV